MTETQCPDALLRQAETVAVSGPADGLSWVDGLLADYRSDARLHFLKGSFLAALGDYADARTAFLASVGLAPAFALARFQLGLLELTLGDPQASRSTLAPLMTLPADNALHLFASGLVHLMNDEFDQSIDVPKQGLAVNRDNPPLSADMQMLVETIGRAEREISDQQAMSAAQLLLLHGRGRQTRH